MTYKTGDIVEDKATCKLAEVLEVATNGGLLVRYIAGGKSSRKKGHTHWTAEDAVIARPDVKRPPLKLAGGWRGDANGRND